MLTISRLIFGIALSISILLVAGTYAIFSGFGDRMLQQSAVQHSHSVANLTYTSMYQLMNQGWKREQVNAFADSIGKSVVGMPMKIDLYRAPVVAGQFGDTPQTSASDEMNAALRTGQAWDRITEQGVQYVMPMKAKTECLNCHNQAKSGDVLGLITIQTSYQGLLGETRTFLVIVLLLLAPLPLVAGFIGMFLFDGRMHRFLKELDEAVDQAKPGETPHFSHIRLHFREFRELLTHFKRLVKR